MKKHLIVSLQEQKRMKCSKLFLRKKIRPQKSRKEQIQQSYQLIAIFQLEVSKAQLSLLLKKISL
jgi:hypothetical protein